MEGWYGEDLVDVYVDGMKEAIVDLCSAAVDPRQVVVFRNAFAASGSHTVEVRVMGAKSASASGTRVDVDAFVSVG